jgi:hypothetical protein
MDSGKWFLLATSFHAPISGVGKQVQRRRS